MAEVIADTVAVDLARAIAVADGLTRHGRALTEGAGGADRSAPTVPEDGLLAALVVRFDEAREGFERRLGEVLESSGGRLTVNALTTRSVDTMPLAHLPEAGR